MSTPDPLTLIRRACEGTPADGLAPYIAHLAPVCVRECPHYSAICCSVDGGLTTGLCGPAVQALAGLAVEGAAEVERLTEALRVALGGDCDGSARGIELSWQKIESPKIAPHDWMWGLVLHETREWPVAAYVAADDGRAIAPSEAHGPIMVELDSWPAACRWIADRARSDGYRVPPHPLGWDVGGGE